MTLPQSLTLFECSSDFGANIPGSRLGPNLLSQTLDYLQLPLQRYHIQTQPQWSSNPRQAHIDMLRQVHHQANVCLAHGSRPLLLGGDHSCSLPTLASLGLFAQQHQRPLYLFWFDAHCDLHTLNSSETGNLHGMPVSMLLGLDQSSLILSAQPYISPECFRLLGARSIDDAERQSLLDHRLFWSSPNMMQCHDLLSQTLEQAPPHSLFHISFDLDSLTPEFASSVSTPVPLGFSMVQALELLSRITRDPRYFCFDFVEFNPLQGDLSQSFQNASRILHALIEPLSHQLPT